MKVPVGGDNAAVCCLPAANKGEEEDVRLDLNAPKE